MSFEVDGMPCETREEAVMALVENYICDAGADEVGAIGDALANPEQTADRVLKSVDLNIAGSGEEPINAEREEIIAAIKAIRDQDFS